jgi:endonuclease/exonuclease/phosphatase family metal-dependent hydrolase
MVPNGSEYPEYIPNFKGWDERAHSTKLANTAKVIKDMNAEIVALQEIENENALKELLAELKKNGVEYPYYEITKNEKTAVQNALISKFKILSYKELPVKGQYRDRPILKATLQIGKNELIVYANHWKAKTGPESKRIEYADTLAADIKGLSCGTDFVALGDFNSNYNEMETFTNDKKLNDTNGITGINHILKTGRNEKNGRLIYSVFLFLLLLSL